MSDNGEAAPNLRSMTRADLEAYAAECGVEAPESYPNKEALIEAIEGAVPADEGSESEADPDAGDEPDEAEALGDEPAAEPAAEPERYRVLKAFTLDDGRTVMPGEEWTPEGGWPARRLHQMNDQKYLRPINDAARAGADAAESAEESDDGNPVQG